MRRMFLDTTKQKGFTFNEILVAMTLASIAVLGSSATITMVIRGNRISEGYTIAAGLAQDKIEQLRSQLRINNAIHCPGDTVRSGLGSGKRVFRRCWEIRDWEDAENLKELRVSVAWDDSEARVITLTTLRFQD